MVAWCRPRLAAGWSQARLATELAMSSATLGRWLKAAPAAAPVTALVPVEIVPDASAATLSIISPSGYELRGLDVAQAVEVLRRLR